MIALPVGCSQDDRSSQAPPSQESYPLDSAPVAVWVRESSAEGYIEGVILDWPLVNAYALDMRARRGGPGQEVAPAASAWHPIAFS